MTAPPVPSSSNNWPKGWICNARSSQNLVLMLDTWVPKSIEVVVSCPCMITGGSLEWPTNQATGSGLRNGAGWLLIILSFVFLLGWSVVVWGQGGNAGCLLLVAVGGGWATFPQFPPTRFKDLAGVAHSQTMWPHPWHLKTLHGTRFLLTQHTSRRTLSLWIWGSHGGSTLAMANWGAVGGGGLTQANLAIVRAGAVRSIPICLSSPMTSVPEAIWCTYRVIALFRPGQGAINLAVWLLSSVESSINSITIADFALTLSQTSSWAATMNSE